MSETISKNCQACGRMQPATVEEHRQAVLDAVSAAYRAGIVVNVKRSRGGVTVTTRANQTEVVGG